MLVKERFGVVLVLVLVLVFLHALAVDADPARTQTPEQSSESSSALGCVLRPTTRVNLVLNFDAGERRLALSRWLFVSFPVYGSFQEAIEIIDLEGNPRTVVLLGGRASYESEWNVAVRARAVSEGALGTGGPIEGEGRIVFDTSGRLIGDAEFSATLNFPYGPEGIIRAQEVVFSFRGSRGESTQFASSSATQSIEQDGYVCAERPASVGICVLDPALLRRPSGEEPENIHFSSMGNYFSNGLQRVQGYRVDPLTGELAQEASDAQVPTMLFPPRATSRLALGFEVAEDAVLSDRPVDVDDVVGFSDTRMMFTVFDSLGALRPFELSLARVSDRRWRWVAERDLSNGFVWLGLTRPYEVLEGGRGELVFSEDGALMSVTQEGRLLPAGEFPVVRLPAELGSDPVHDVEVDFGVGRTAIGEVDRVFEISQDGYGPGILSSLSVSTDFRLVGGLSNGTTIPISKLAFASSGEAICEFECSDGFDDDGDGLIDVRDDPGCSSGIDASERSAAYPCDNGLDTDGDGLSGYPDDPGCESPFGDDQLPPNLEVAVSKVIRMGPKKRIVEVAILNRGGLTFSSVDPSSLQLRVGGRVAQAIVAPGSADASAADLAESPLSRDVDGDGARDRVFRFALEGPARKNRRGTFCLTGALDPGMAVVPSRLDRILIEFRYRQYGRVDFKSCARDRRLNIRTSRRGAPDRKAGWSERRRHSQKTAPGRRPRGAQ